MTRPLILADLDDSLFQTRAKCGDWAEDDLRLMSRLADGSPSGYATPPQQALLGWLAHGELVPVTARARDVRPPQAGPQVHQRALHQPLPGSRRAGL